MLRDAKSLQLARALPWRRAFCNQQKIWRGPFVLALALARCPGVAMGLRWCCDDVVPLGSPCTSLVHPLYIPCTSLVHPLYIPPATFHPSIVGAFGRAWPASRVSVRSNS